jgi:hypothetical protein
MKSRTAIITLRAALLIVGLITVGLTSACSEPAARQDRPAGEPVGTVGRAGEPAPPAAEPAPAPKKTDDVAAPGVIERVKNAVTPGPAFREVTIPAGTVLPLVLRSSVGSDVSSVEDTVRAETRAPIVVGGISAIPAGSPVIGSVTSARRSARVKGRATVAFRFHTLEARDDRYRIRTGTVARTAPGTKKKDAATIGIPAAGGAIIGGVAGGKKGAAIGGAIGGGAGTTAVLTTRGKEVRFAPGARVAVKLTQPVTVRVPVR